MSAYSAAVLALNPSAYWRFSGNGNDETANARNTTVGGGASYPTGATTDGDTALRGTATLAFASWMTPTTAVSWVTWYKSGGPNNMALMGRSDSMSTGTFIGWRTGVEASGKIQAATCQASGALNGLIQTAATTWHDSAWHMIGCVWVPGTLKMSIDGAASASASAASSLYEGGAARPLDVGNFLGNNATTANTVGAVDDAAVWIDTALTDSDWASLYSLGTAVASHTRTIIRRPLRGLIVR